MLYKRLNIPARDADGNARVATFNGIEKLAAQINPDPLKGITKESFTPELVSFLKTIKPSPEEFSYIVVIPIGAMEFWGPNTRGDAVLEDDLAPSPQRMSETAYKKRPYGYRTFVNGKFFCHHANKPKDGDKVYGDIVFANYNKRMHWPELVIKAFRVPLAQDHPDVLGWIDSGEPFDVSMGMYAAADTCGYCGNTRRKPTDKACPHIQRDQVNTIAEDGRVYCMVNHMPVFHDLSAVPRGADSLGHGILKVASAGSAATAPTVASRLPASVIQRTVLNMAKKGWIPRNRKVPATSTSQATLEKRSTLSRLIDVFEKEASLPEEALMRAGAVHGVGLLEACIAESVLLTPSEFGAVVLGATNAPRHEQLNYLAKKACAKYPDSVGNAPAIEAHSASPAAVAHVRDALAPKRGVSPRDLVNRMVMSAGELTLGKTAGAHASPWHWAGDAAADALYAEYVGAVHATIQAKAGVSPFAEYGLVHPSDLESLGIPKIASVWSVLELVVPAWLLTRLNAKVDRLDAKVPDSVAPLALNFPGKQPESAPTPVLLMPDLRPPKLSPREMKNKLTQATEDI